MGLITSVNNIQYELEKQKEIRLIEQKEKRKAVKQKENLQRYKNDLEMYLKKEFSYYLNLIGTSYTFEFYSKDRKKELLINFFETIKQQDSNGFEIIPFKRELEEHFYNKYNTILKKCEKEQEQEEIFQTITQGKEIEAERTKEQQEEEEDEKLVKIFKITGIVILCILFFPLVLILSIIFGASKNL